MSIFEAVGAAFIILTSCIGCYTIGAFVVAGIRYTARLVDIGAKAERDPAIVDMLNSISEERRAR